MIQLLLKNIGQGLVIFLLIVNSAKGEPGIQNCLSVFPPGANEEIIKLYTCNHQTQGCSTLEEINTNESEKLINNHNIYFICNRYLSSTNTMETISAIAFNGERGIPDWVAYKLTPDKMVPYNPFLTTAQKPLHSLVRLGNFYMNEDLKLLNAKQASLHTYKNVIRGATNKVIFQGRNLSLKKDSNGKEVCYTQGHFMPAADTIYSPEALDTSFSFANAAPQYPNMNSGVWQQIEAAIRNFVIKSKNDVYIITGVYGTSYGQSNYPHDLIGAYPNYQVKIPACFYKIVYTYNETNESTNKSIAFLVPNTDTTKKGAWQNYALSVEQLFQRMNWATSDIYQDHNYGYQFSLPNTNIFDINLEFWLMKTDPKRYKPIWFDLKTNLNKSYPVMKELLGTHLFIPGC